MERSPGLGLAEALASLVVVALLAMIVLPASADLRRAGLTAAAARDLAVRFHALRWKSVARHRHHGLFFSREGEAWVWFEVSDGNGNGLRTAEIRDGTDPTLSGPHRLSDRLAPVRMGFPPGGRIPRIPPRRGYVDDLDDPVRFGRSDLVSFSPLGASSSGTLFVTDGRNELYGVVLFGPTARVRVWRYDRRTRQWSL
jgi:hypothetical protein